MASAIRTIPRISRYRKDVAGSTTVKRNVRIPFEVAVLLAIIAGADLHLPTVVAEPHRARRNAPIR